VEAGVVGAGVAGAGVAGAGVAASLSLLLLLSVAEPAPIEFFDAPEPIEPCLEAAGAAVDGAAVDGVALGVRPIPIEFFLNGDDGAFVVGAGVASELFSDDVSEFIDAPLPVAADLPVIGAGETAPLSLLVSAAAKTAASREFIDALEPIEALVGTAIDGGSEAESYPQTKPMLEVIETYFTVRKFILKHKVSAQRWFTTQSRTNKNNNKKKKKDEKKKKHELRGHPICMEKRKRTNIDDVLRQ
jgi:hypothetical protein